ncbi:hypothetical protein BHE74_00018676 [Ensete ventricosum]|nr:hypothetical protein BHE74_00018676 [Ensete ventricosum]
MDHGDYNERKEHKKGFDEKPMQRLRRWRAVNNQTASHFNSYSSWSTQLLEKRVRERESDKGERRARYGARTGGSTERRNDDDNDLIPSADFGDLRGSEHIMLV